MSDGRRVRAVVIGPPGAGKTTVGRMLADRLGVEFRDTDTDVETESGKPIADIFVDEGEARFRELEARAVRVALSESDGVVALGGGAVMTEATQADLSGLPVIFLDVDITDAAKRIGFNRDRPLLLGNPRARWIELMAARRPVYEKVASIAVKTDGRSPEDIAGEIAARLSG